jgi:hypothetical protein
MVDITNADIININLIEAKVQCRKISDKTKQIPSMVGTKCADLRILHDCLILALMKIRMTVCPINP